MKIKKKIELDNPIENPSEEIYPAVNVAKVSANETCSVLNRTTHRVFASISSNRKDKINFSFLGRIDYQIFSL